MAQRLSATEERARSDSRHLYPSHPLRFVLSAASTTSRRLAAMTRAIADDLFGPNNAFWDFIYPAVVLALGVAATVAIYLDFARL
jgi:hypothetical protein